MTHSILCVVGARPNFVKVAPVVHALERLHDVEVPVVNTGQHYDRALAGSFIEHLGMRAPDYDLGVGSGTHARQTAAVPKSWTAETAVSPHIRQGDAFTVLFIPVPSADHALPFHFAMRLPGDVKSPPA